MYAPSFSQKTMAKCRSRTLPQAMKGPRKSSQRRNRQNVGGWFSATMRILAKIVANRNDDEGAEVGPLPNGFAYGVLTESVARPDLLVAEALVPDIDRGIFD